MKKIQIQFNESDYKVYHNYCLKYYQVHDTARRQSIHAFLDLYEKNLLIVEEQDIRPAREFLSEKCDEFKKVQGATHGEADSTMHLQVRLCSDLLLFLDDLEKMYRLLKKQGVVPNYLMILGTFSRVIEESRNAPASDLYNLDYALVNSLAGPLAEIIRKRLGTDREWRSVLQELAFIAARFNQKFPGPAFDLDIVRLVAPAVVTHFNKNVETREILAALSSCFEECELDEFESLLNRTPEALKIDQETDIDWDAITDPLEAIAGAVAKQRDELSRSRLKIADSSLLVPATGFRSSGEDGRTSETTPVSSPPMPVAGGYKSFDIAVTHDGSTQVESPIRAYPLADEPLAKPDLKPFIPVIIGFTIIVLFIVGTMVLSGDWNPMGAGNVTNSTNASQKNVTPAKATIKPGATTAPKATTAKIKVTPTPTPKSYSSTEIGNHLLDIAFGPDNSKTVKPTKDLVAIACSGAYTDSDVDLLNTFISQFNSQSSTTKLSDNIQFTGRGDIPLDFLPEKMLNQIEIKNGSYVYKDFDTGTTYFVRTDEKTFLNSDLNGNKRKQWILRAVLYDLGFQGETAKYSDSLFYSGQNTVAQPNTVDWKAIQLMYGKKITNGMTKAQVKALVV